MSHGNLPFPRITLKQALLHLAPTSFDPMQPLWNTKCVPSSGNPIPIPSCTPQPSHSRGVVGAATHKLPEGERVFPRPLPRLLTGIPAALSFDLFPSGEEYEDLQRKVWWVPLLRLRRFINLDHPTAEGNAESQDRNSIWLFWVALQHAFELSLYSTKRASLTFRSHLELHIFTHTRTAVNTTIFGCQEVE
jgi:hypothetical protein